MPNPKKPAAVRQRRGTPDVGTVDAVAPVLVDGVPSPPLIDGVELSGEVVEQWAEFWRSPLAALVLPADRPALDNLFVCRELRRRFRAIAVREPFVSGSTGQIVAHPALREVASLTSQIQALEDRFGLTPAGRLRLGVMLGPAARSLETLNRDFADHSEPAGPSLGSRTVEVESVEVDPRRPAGGAA